MTSQETAAYEQVATEKARLAKDLDNRFTYHAPKNGQASRYSGIRNEVMELALYLADMCPPSRELSLAITHLEEAVFWANASISRHE